MRPLAFATTPLAAGRAGTVATLRAMAALAVKGARHPDVIRAAHAVVRRVPERDDVATMKALLADVRRRMRYTRDPLDVELVKAPWTSIGQSDLHGVEPMDCDDASTMLAAMLGAVGIPSRFVVVPTDPNRPREFSHVYVTARTSDGRWLPLDPIVRGFDVGQEVPAGRLSGPRGYMNVAGVGCDGCHNCKSKERCGMRNRLNGSNFGPSASGSDSNFGETNFGEAESSFGGVGGMGAIGPWDAAQAVGTKFVEAKYGPKGKRYPQTSNLDVSTLPPPQPFRMGAWLNPLDGGTVNVKALVVWGVLGFIGWKYLKSGKRKSRR